MNESKLKRRIFRLTVNALFAGFLSGATAMLWFVKVIDSTDNINSFLNVLRQQSDLQYAFALACLTIAVYFGSDGGGSIGGGTKANVLPDPVSAQDSPGCQHRVLLVMNVQNSLCTFVLGCDRILTRSST